MEVAGELREADLAGEAVKVELRKERERVFWVFWFLLLFFFYFSSFFRLFYIQEEMASFSPLLTGVGRERGFGEVERVVEEGRGQREREDEKRRQRFSSPSSTSS